MLTFVDVFRLMRTKQDWQASTSPGDFISLRWEIYGQIDIVIELQLLPSPSINRVSINSNEIWRKERSADNYSIICCFSVVNVGYMLNVSLLLLHCCVAAKHQLGERIRLVEFRNSSGTEVRILLAVIFTSNYVSKFEYFT
jgi:hypothetical protein